VFSRGFFFNIIFFHRFWFLGACGVIRNVFTTHQYGFSLTVILALECD
jgi:hypothetical protein